MWQRKNGMRVEKVMATLISQAIAYSFNSHFFLLLIRLNREWKHNNGPFQVARVVNRKYEPAADEPDEDSIEAEEAQEYEEGEEEVEAQEYEEGEEEAVEAQEYEEEEEEEESQEYEEEDEEGEERQEEEEQPSQGEEL
jgi:hypothetical protein